MDPGTLIPDITTPIAAGLAMAGVVGVWKLSLAVASLEAKMELILNLLHPQQKAER